MWMLGALLGLWLGGMLGQGLWLPGAILGGVAGFLLARNNAPRAPEQGAVSDRLDRLEREIAALRKEVSRLQAGEAEPALARSDAAAPPVGERPAPVAAEPRQADAGEDVVAPPDAPISEGAASAAPEASRHERPIDLPPWLARLAAGNPLAKIGIVLLFFGVASGLKLVVEHGLMPVPLRLFLAAAAGVSLIAFGFRKAGDLRHRTFGLALQGGGFALLYLVGYFMLARYIMIGQGLGFALFAALGIACVGLAVRQDGPALAVLGISGAFLAPVLAGGQADTPLPLFIYFALLNAFILGVDWFKAWRVLNVAGFVMTLAVGMAWAVEGYRDTHFLVTQLFVVLFLAVYSAMPPLTALLRAPGLSGWLDGALLFGTPLAGAFLQAVLMADVPYGRAWSALVGSLWYFALWALLFRRPEPEIRLVERSHLGIAIALLTVSVPLAFGAQVTSAFWAAEGAAVLWFGVRQQRALAQGVGLAMQVAAGIALLLGWPQLGHRLPVANDAVLGSVVLIAAGLAVTRLMRSLESEAGTGATSPVAPMIPFIWAVSWWLGTGLGEIHRFAASEHHAAYGLLFVSATVAGLEGFAVAWRWPQIRGAALLLLAGSWLAVLMTFDRRGHAFAGFMVLALPLALLLHYVLLARHERTAETPHAAVRHLGAWWLLLMVLPAEAAWQASRLAPNVSLWPLVIWTGAFAGGSALPAIGQRLALWPFSAREGRYLPLGILPPLAGLVFIVPWANLFHAGQGSGLPYLPLLSFFDAAQGLAMGALLALSRQMDGPFGATLRRLTAAFAFLWLSALAARLAHHWGGVPFDIGALVRSTLFQALLTLFWTLAAIATMIVGARRALRRQWFIGFGLLSVVGLKLLLFDAMGRGTATWAITLIGVALLVLAAGYFAPLPPDQPPERDT